MGRPCQDCRVKVRVNAAEMQASVRALRGPVARVVAGVVALWGGLSAAGCLPSISDLHEGPLTSSFAVSDFFTPSGYMGDGMFFGNLTGTINQGCKPRPPGARGNCYVFTYYPLPDEGDPWAGVYWVFPANNWGSIRGRAVDTTRFQQIRFAAAVEAPTPFRTDGADRFLTTFAGRIDPGGKFDVIGAQTKTNLKDHVDAFDLHFDAQVGPDVGPDLKTFHVPITDAARSGNCTRPHVSCANGAADALIGAFGWSIPYPFDGDPSRTSPVKIYLDDIVWDTSAVE
jgi:hypothetical protein